MTRTAAPWRDPSTADRCTASVAAVARDLFTWHRRGITVRMVEPAGDDGVLLGVEGPVEALPAVHQLLIRHYRFPITCYAWT
jgi:hypothetical protein